MDVATLHDRAAGCVLGLALGDALGAPFEGSSPGARPTFASLRLAGRRLTYTDDTEMMIGLVEALLENPLLEQDRLAERFATNFTSGRGYGGGTRELLMRIRRGEPWSDIGRSVFPEGSLGNGAAMRTAPVGPLHAFDKQALRDVARRQAEVTHTHPLGQAGAVLIASAAAVAFQHRAGEADGQALLDDVMESVTEPVYEAKLRAARACLTDEHDPERVIRELGNSVEAPGSTVTAVYLFARFPTRFDQAVSAAVELGGDTDTIAAMAGALVGACIGASALHANGVAQLENHGRLAQLAMQYADLVVSRQPQ